MSARLRQRGPLAEEMQNARLVRTAEDGARERVFENEVGGERFVSRHWRGNRPGERVDSDEVVFHFSLDSFVLDKALSFDREEN